MSFRQLKIIHLVRCPVTNSLVPIAKCRGCTHYFGDTVDGDKRFVNTSILYCDISAERFVGKGRRAKKRNKDMRGYG